MDVRICFRCKHETMVVHGNRGHCANCGHSYGPRPILVVVRREPTEPAKPTLCPKCGQEPYLPLDGDGGWRCACQDQKPA